MNTIELQSIVFIFAIDAMFLTTPSDRHPIKSDIAGPGCDVWTHITLTMDFPWYCLSYRSSDGADDGLEKTDFLSNPVQVREFMCASQNAIQFNQLLLVSPPRLNRTHNWQMEPLSEVWRGRPTNNSFFIYVYMLQDGRRYDNSPVPIDMQALQDLTQLVRFAT